MSSSTTTSKNDMPNEELLRRVEELERQMREHNHSTLERRINLRDIFGKIEVVSTAPATKPTDIGGQLKIYTSGGTLRFYWYDTTAGAWHYVTATA